MKQNKKTVAVIGAGISGLTAAYVLSKNGFNTILVEKNSYTGGLAATFAYKNYLLDYGPHNIHTHIPGIIDFIKNELKIQLKSIPVRSSKLYFRGKFINYPFRFIDIFKNLSWWFSFKCFVGYVIARFKLRLIGYNNKGSFEGWVKSRFGAKLYNLYFGSYVKKIWGIPASEIDEVVARKRMPEPSLLALIVRSLTGLRFGAKHPEDPRTFTSYYIPQGIGLLSETLAKKITDLGSEIKLNCAIDKIKIINGNNLITFVSDVRQFSIQFDYLINTIPLNEFVSCVQANNRNDMERSSAALSYRSIVLLYMFLKVEKVFDDPWVYFNEGDNPDLIFNRVSEFGNFSKDMIDLKQGGVLCFEITCCKNDNIWKMSDPGLYDKCISYLESKRLLKRDIVREYFVKRIDIAYPVFVKGYKEQIKSLLKSFFEAGNIFCIGRQGLFTYTNMDHCIDMGLRLQNLIDNKKLSMENYRKIYSDYLD